MQKVCSSQQQIDEHLASLGFVKSDGKFYYESDSTRASYLVVSMNTSTGATDLSYYGSDGTQRQISSSAQSRYFCMIEDFALKNGGIGLRISFDSTATVSPTMLLQIAIVAKEDGNGFVYFVGRMGQGNFVYFDDLSGVVSIPSTTAYTGAFAPAITDTSSLVMTIKMYNNRDAFIDAYARAVLATQQTQNTALYTFMSNSKKYLCGLCGLSSVSNLKGGQIAFEID